MRVDRPSATAKLIARSTLICAQHPERRRLVAPGAVEFVTEILHQCGRGRWFDSALSQPPVRQWAGWLEAMILPGILLHYLARKRWIEYAVTAALEREVDRVVVLGGGFDTLTWRLHRVWPRKTFVELDHPATQAPKSAAVSRLRGGDNLVLQPADLMHALPSMVLGETLEPSAQRRTCFVAEGLLMYFSAERVTALLRDLLRLNAVRLVFSFMIVGPDGKAGFRGGRVMIDSWLRLVNEPFQWAVARANIDTFLRSCGWQVEALAGSAELRAEILGAVQLQGAPLAEGEILCTAVPLR